jgi:hypothetical protein
MIDIINKKNSTEDIIKKRAKIANRIMRESSSIQSEVITSISSLDLKLMFELYDAFFFGGWFKDSYQGKLKLSLSKRMTKSAGATICPKNIAEINPEDLVLEIRIGVDFLFNYGMLKGPIPVNGINTSNSLQALQLVFEHELCHVIEYLCFYASKCSGDRFMTIANNLFGHTARHHNLPTYRQIAHHKLVLNIGDTVYFTFKGKKLKGILNNITKRATVLVLNKNGCFVDKQGNRYSKYYVPLELLEPGDY